MLTARGRSLGVLKLDLDKRGQRPLLTINFLLLTHDSGRQDMVTVRRHNRGDNNRVVVRSVVQLYSGVALCHGTPQYCRAEGFRTSEAIVHFTK